MKPNTRDYRAEYGEDLVAKFTAQLNEDGATRVWLSTLSDPAVTVAALVLAIVTGTGPVVGMFLLFAVAALVVARLALKAAGSTQQHGKATTSHWRVVPGHRCAVARDGNRGDQRSPVAVAWSDRPYHNRHLLNSTVNDTRLPTTLVLAAASGVRNDEKPVPARA